MQRGSAQPRTGSSPARRDACPRMMLSGGLAMVLSFLISLVHSQTTTNSAFSGPVEITRTLFFWLACVHALVLPLWAFSATSRLSPASA